jgi:hypothetical protein
MKPTYKQLEEVAYSEQDLTTYARKYSFTPHAWQIISEHQNLSESFMKEFERKLVTQTICIRQKFSHQFALEMNWYKYARLIKVNQKMSKEEIDLIVSTLTIVHNLTI